MANKKQSPCLTCVKVKNPNDCENKRCKVWRGWFFQRWNEIQMAAEKLKGE